jgi:hypothetical protein
MEYAAPDGAWKWFGLDSTKMSPLNGAGFGWVCCRLAALPHVAAAGLVFFWTKHLPGAKSKL